MSEERAASLKRPGKGRERERDEGVISLLEESQTRQSRRFRAERPRHRLLASVSFLSRRPLFRLLRLCFILYRIAVSLFFSKTRILS